MEVTAQVCKLLAIEQFDIIAVQPASIDIRCLETGTEATISLINLLRQANLGMNKQWLVKRFVQKVTDAMRDATEIRLENIFPRLIPFSEQKTMRTPWKRALIGKEIDLTLVHDRGSQVSFLKPFDIPKLGVSLAELEKIAIANLWEISKPYKPQFFKGMYLVETKDGFDAARALIAHRWFSDQQNFFWAIPSRDSLWLFPVIGDEKLPDEFKIAVGKAYATMPYPIRGRFFLQDDLL